MDTCFHKVNDASWEDRGASFVYRSPYGELLLGSFQGRLCMCDWVSDRRKAFMDRRMHRLLHVGFEPGTSEVMLKTVTQLDEYFANKRAEFDIPLLFVGTDFQQAVWRELLHIPYGKTISYGELSQALGCPRSVRAVAAAVGANAISILVPCHRVIGSNRLLTGYAGGLAAKRGLLALEGNDLFR